MLVLDTQSDVAWAEFWANAKPVGLVRFVVILVVILFRSMSDECR